VHYFRNKSRYFAVSLTTFVLAVISLHAQQPREFVRLAADFNPTPANGNPSGFLVSSNKLYFVATDGTHGIELWQTDGTNMTRLTDLSYGSDNSFIGAPVEYNGELYFRGSGTTNGTINLEL
jgi:ELWxxDGT repeat protein